MHVRDGMSSMVLTVGPQHTLREAARLMSKRSIGAAVVIDPDSPGPGIITERDLMESIGAGQDPDTEIVANHLTASLVFAAPDWSLEEAAVAMVRGGFRHLVVTEGGDIAGILSVRDVVRRAHHRNVVVAGFVQDVQQHHAPRLKRPSPECAK